MVRSRLVYLAAMLTAAGLATGASAQITFTNGSSYVEANVNGTPIATNTPSIPATFATSVTNGPVVVGGATLNSSASFNSAVTATSASITGNTAASRTQTGAVSGVTSAFGLSAPNNPSQGGTTAGAPIGYGYFTNFTITQTGVYNFNVGFNPTLTNTGTGSTNNEAYGDFQAYLYDINRSRVYSLGGFRDNTNGVLTGFNDPGDLSALLPSTATQIGVGLGSNLLNLATGQYQLYLQSQAFVSGVNGNQTASVNTSSASLTFVSAAIPEPASLTVFGAVAVGGLATMLRRRKSVA